MEPQANSANLQHGISIERIRVWTLLLSAAGTGAAFWRFGPGAAASFSVGALASFFNLQLLHAVVGRLGPEPMPGSRRIATLFVLRYLVLGLLGYATVKVFGVNPASFCFGLLVATVALLLDSLTELIYARA